MAWKPVICQTNARLRGLPRDCRNDGQLQEPQERNRYWKTAGDQEGKGRGVGWRQASARLAPEWCLKRKQCPNEPFIVPKRFFFLKKEGVAFLHKGNVVGHYDGFIQALFRALILALGRYAWPPPPPLPFPSPSPPSIPLSAPGPAVSLSLYWRLKLAQKPS